MCKFPAARVEKSAVTLTGLPAEEVDVNWIMMLYRVIE
jgi:hypothetical protein